MRHVLPRWPVILTFNPSLPQCIGGAVSVRDQYVERSDLQRLHPTTTAVPAFDVASGAQQQPIARCKIYAVVIISAISAFEETLEYIGAAEVAGEVGRLAGCAHGLSHDTLH